MKYLSVLTHSSLFKCIKENELLSILSCLSPIEHTYKKGEYIFQYGQNTNMIGLVLSGSVHIFKDDFWGVRVIIGEASAGNLFGEGYACAETETLEVNVIAAENTDILFLDIKRILTVCSATCSFHTQLIHNLLSILAQKNLMLTRKINHMSKRTTREKLLSYLSSESLKAGGITFEIPFNRQQLADYLCVDRSAMSNELCKMRKEGLLSFEKNKFHLKEGSQENF